LREPQLADHPQCVCRASDSNGGRSDHREWNLSSDREKNRHPVGTSACLMMDRRGREQTRMNMKIITTLIAAAFAVTSFQARAEVNEVKLARQFGLHYLPLVLMEKHNLIEKAAAAAHVDLKASWLQISASGINESLLSGAIDVSATGTGPLVLMWDRTHGNLGVKGIAAISEVPMIL